MMLTYLYSLSVHFKYYCMSIGHEIKMLKKIKMNTKFASNEDNFLKILPTTTTIQNVLQPVVGISTLNVELHVLR